MIQLQIYSIQPKIDMVLFVDLAKFTCFYQFLQIVIIKLFWPAEQFYDHIMQELVKKGTFSKSTNNPLSSFGLIE